MYRILAFRKNYFLWVHPATDPSKSGLNSARSDLYFMDVIASDWIHQRPVYEVFQNLQYSFSVELPQLFEKKL